ncbi:hypothetical protein VTL71DRAFT_8959 [Oculimacula yallundae]|uniref:Uncharacterized protein n=1 Tax=Oculimacula yallundae TaxID=86028 RepID=A0ABR4BTC9_9HELO
MSLQGKVALITGGAKNLGALIALSFAEQGANLSLHYNSPSTASAAKTLQATLSSKYPNIKVAFFVADLTSEVAVNKLFSDTVAEFEKVDIVINTVGMVLKKPLIQFTEAEYDNMSAVNTKSAFLIFKASGLNVADGGKIITIVTSLVGAFTGFYTAYAGTKGAVEHFSRGLAKELVSKRISVNCIAPGPMDTPFFYPQETDDSIAYLKSGAMEGRLTTIEDIAPIVKFLVTEGQWINGQTIFANGGALAAR